VNDLFNALLEHSKPRMPCVAPTSVAFASETTDLRRIENMFASE